MAKHVQRGDDARLLSLTTGVVSHAFGIFPATGADKLRDVERVKGTKRREFEADAAAIGASRSRLLDLPESPLIVGAEGYHAIVDEIRDHRPDVVLCPHPAEFGSFDHMDAGRVAIAAIDYARSDGYPSALGPWLVGDVFTFYYENHRSGQFLGAPRQAPDVVVDITTVVDRKRAAMAAFAGTQAKPGEDYGAKLDRFFASVDGALGYAAGTGYVERFSHELCHKRIRLHLAGRDPRLSLVVLQRHVHGVLGQPIPRRFGNPVPRRFGTPSPGARYSLQRDHGRRRGGSGPAYPERR